VWLVATRGLCEAQSGLGSATSSLLNVQPMLPLPLDMQRLFVFSSRPIPRMRHQFLLEHPRLTT